MDVNVSSLFGAKTKQGIVQIQLGEFETQLSILEAKKVAYMILEAAEAASTDEAIHNFFEKLGMNREQCGAALMELRKLRNNSDPRFFED